MTIVGIDVGMKGGVAVLEDNFRLQLHTMMRPRLLFDMFGVLHCHVYIEKAQPMARPGKTGGIKQTFAYGMGYGKLIAAIECSGTPYTEVRPQEWKKVVLCGMDKSDKQSSIKRAQQLFPATDFRVSERCKKPSDGLCEAALIAWYGWNLGKGG